MRKLVVIFILVFLSPNLFSQNYPVEIYGNWDSSFSPYWSNLQDPNYTPLSFTLTYSDLVSGSVNVALSIKISGPDFELKSNTKSPLVTLQPGLPSIISPAIISSLFRVSNLDLTQGNNPFLNDRLSPGDYEVCITAYISDFPYQQISQEFCLSYTYSLNEPAILFSPDCESILSTADQLSFQWSVPFSNQTLPGDFEYTLEIFSNPLNLNPNLLVNSSHPMVSISLSDDYYFYSPADPPLYFGISYCWRVKTRSLSGEYFVNDGYSAPCSFQLGESQQGTPELIITNVQSHSARCDWNDLLGSSFYSLSIRNTQTQNWTEITTVNSEFLFGNLLAQTYYEVRVKSIFPASESNWSNSVTFCTQPEMNFSCGNNDSVFQNNLYTPLNLLYPGMNFKAGKFTVQALEVHPGNNPGYFSGRGRVNIYGVLPLSVSFDHIFIDDDLTMRTGQLIAESDGLGNWINNNTVGTISSGLVNTEITWDDVVDSISIDTETGEIIINNESSGLNWDPESGNTISDANGNLWIVTTDGDVVLAGQSGGGNGIASPEQNIIYPDRGSVIWTSSPEQQYGLDLFTYPELIHYYNKVLVAGRGESPVSWKSIQSLKYDRIVAELSMQPGIHYDSIRCITATGSVFYYELIASNKIHLWLIGGDHGDGQELFIQVLYAGEWVSIGKINLVHYNRKQIRAHFISTENSNPNFSEIKRIFISGLADFSWSTHQINEPQNWDINQDGRLESTGYNYSEEYLKWIDHIKSQSWFSDQDYYIIQSPVSPSNQELNAEMPAGKNFGFLFGNENISRTIAHELGHGAFGWLHTFSGNVPIQQGGTDNLMDYSQGTHLFKFQWDKIHDPSWLQSLGLNEDDIAISGLSGNNPKINVSGKSFCYYTPSGKILCSDTLSHVEFNNAGALTWFRSNSGNHYGAVGSSNGYFLGYINLAHANGLEGPSTTERLSQLNALLIKEFPVGNSHQFLSQVAKIIDGSVYDCRCIYNWNNPSISGGKIEGIEVFPIIPDTARKSNCSGSQCFDLNGLNAGVGKQLFLKLRPFLPTGNSEDELKNLCNEFNTKANGKTFAFYGYGLENLSPGSVVGDALVNQFLDKAIFTRSAFLNAFPYFSFARNADVIFSAADLRSDIIDNYNANSIDYKARNGGNNLRYEYSFGDLVSRQLHKSDPQFGEVLRLENEGLAAPICQADFYDQYVAQFGTNSAFPFMASWSAKWAKDIVITLTIQQGIKFLPQLLSLYGGRKFLSDVFIGAVIDFLIQAGIEYYFAEEDISFSQAMARVDYYQATSSGFENAIGNIFNDKYALLISAGLSCITDGFTQNGELRESFDYQSCAGGILSAILINRISVGAVALLKKIPTERLVRGFRRLGIGSPVQMDPVLEWLGKHGDLRPFAKSQIDLSTGFSDQLPAWLARRNLSLEEFKQLQQKTYAEISLNPAEKAIMDEIRDAVPFPDQNTVLQKVVSQRDIQKYFNPNYLPRGFISTAADAKHLNSIEDYYYGLRLDYKIDDIGTQAFYTNDENIFIIRFTISNPENISIPKNLSNPSPPPFMNSGITGGTEGRLGVPEYVIPESRLTRGVIFKLNELKEETIFGFYDESLKSFIQL